MHTKEITFRVLSLDGGGIRGLYSAVLLHELAKRIAKTHGQPTDRLDVGRGFDLIAGTSTGALLAAALAAGVPLEDVITLYKGNASSIFRDPTPLGGLRPLLWAARRLGGAANPPDALRAALVGIFENETVKGVYDRRGIALCVPTVNAETHRSWVYKTPHDLKENRLQRDNDYRLVDVCLSSAAAPLVFPMHEVPKPGDAAGHVNWFVDGGLWANNPVLVALVEALSFAPEDAQIELLSISTCPPFQAPSVTQASSNRGLLGWKGGIGMLEVAIDAQSCAYDYIAKTLAEKLGKRIKYIRLTDPKVSSSDAGHLRLDNPSPECLKTLIRLGNDAVDLNISEATTGERPKALLMEIFKDLPTMPTTKGADHV